MASSIHPNDVQFFKGIIERYEPYPIEKYENMALDERGYDNDMRYSATICLKALLDAGFTEEEVNPWKNKH